MSQEKNSRKLGLWIENLNVSQEGMGLGTDHYLEIVPTLYQIKCVGHPLDGSKSSWSVQYRLACFFLHAHDMCEMLVLSGEAYMIYVSHHWSLIYRVVFSFLTFILVGFCINYKLSSLTHSNKWLTLKWHDRNCGFLVQASPWSSNEIPL